jgi:hypothetical protein
MDKVGAARSRVTVIIWAPTFPAPSSASTRIVVDDPARVTVLFQFAVPFPDAVPLFATWPLTVTREIPLSPNPLSVAVPLTETVDDVTNWPGVGLTIERLGAIVSAGPLPWIVQTNDFELVSTPSDTNIVTV